MTTRRLLAWGMIGGAVGGAAFAIGHVLGFLAVFSAIVFAIARILGEFRAGGGTVQETVGARVQTLKMPKTGRGMLVSMVIGMMLLLATIIHVLRFQSVRVWELAAEVAERRG